MKQFTGTAKILFSGLFLAQIGFMLLVYISNRQLLEALGHVSTAGYFAIPNSKVMSSLGNVSTAFKGGLFFTFTLGAGISVGAFACAWLWHYIFKRNKKVLFCLVVFWLSCIVSLNLKGIIIVVSGVFLIIPPTVFCFTLKWRNNPLSHAPSSYLYLHLLLFLTLFIAGMFFAGSNPFIHFRDTFLLSNRPGMAINNFYYRYTLHAARVFKRLDQKTFNTCSINVGEDDILQNRVQNVLTRHDYFSVNNSSQIDLSIEKKGKFFLFKHQGEKIFQCGVKAFFQKPSVWLKQFSAETDRYGLLRRMIFISLMMGIPAFTYAFSCALVQIFFYGMGLTEKYTFFLAPILITLVGIILLAMLAQHSTISDNVRQNPIKALSSRQVHQRIAALKSIGSQRLDIGNYQRKGTLLDSPHAAERYWSVRALAFATGGITGKHLLAMLDDPQPNVVCQVFYALGQRKNPAVVPEIMHRIKNSDHWYIQWYGYRAAKKLGWKQTVLK
jgi:hypothetical protein